MTSKQKQIRHIKRVISEIHNDATGWLMMARSVRKWGAGSEAVNAKLSIINELRHTIRILNSLVRRTEAGDDSPADWLRRMMEDSGDKKNARRISMSNAVNIVSEAIQKYPPAMQEVLVDVHISSIYPGDTVFHNGLKTTVGTHDIQYSSFMGHTLFGDSYNCGNKKVRKVIYIKQD